MKKKNSARIADLVNNPTARVPVCLCLDTSASMNGAPINELNAGVKLFYDSIKNDETARYAAEVCVITFGGIEPLKIVDFVSMDVQMEALPILEARGATPMGEAINQALDLLEDRKNEYQENGVDYYQPWLVLMTDGHPNGVLTELERAIARTSDLCNKKKLTIFPIGIGNDADMNTLAKLSPNRTPLKLKGLEFRNFFAWLSQSVSKVSQSMPGEKITLDIDAIKGWAEF